MQKSNKNYDWNLQTANYQPKIEILGNFNTSLNVLETFQGDDCLESGEVQWCKN